MHKSACDSLNIFSAFLFVVCRATTHNVIKCCETHFPPLPAKRSEVNVVHAFYDRPHPQGSTIYLRMCVCVPETDRRPHKSSCKWPELNWLGLVAAVLVWGIVSFLYLEKLEERGDGGEPAGSRKCVLRAAINDSIECLMAPYKASTRSSRCTYSLSAGKVERRQLFSLCAVTVKL